MYPDQQQPAPYNPHTPGDPYQFIMEPPKKQKMSGPGKLAGNPFIMKLLFIVGGAVVIMFTLGIVVNIFFGGRTSVEEIVTITQTQQEIVRMSGENTKASDQTIKNAAVSAQLALTSQQTDWLAYLAKNGRGVDAKELALKRNAAIDQQLTQAQQTSTFDVVYGQLMYNNLVAYQGLVKKTLENAANNTEREMLTGDYQEILILLEQWPQSKK